MPPLPASVFPVLQESRGKKNADEKRLDRALTTFIMDSVCIWVGGWFMLVVLEIALIWIKGFPWGVPPWTPIIAVTLLFYCGVGLIGGCMAGGVIALTLTLVRKWRQRIAAIPLTMASCIATITLIYSGPRVHHQLLQHYPSFSQTLSIVVLILSGLLLLSIIYVLCTTLGTKTRLGIFYSILSFGLYAIMIVGFSIFGGVLPGKPFNPDSRGILIAAGILFMGGVLYVLVYNLGPVIRNRAGIMGTSISRRVWMVVIVIVLIIAGILSV